MKRSWGSPSFIFGMTLGALTVCAISIVFVLISKPDTALPDKQNSVFDHFGVSNLGTEYFSQSEIDDLSQSGAMIERRFLSMAPYERTLAFGELLHNLNERDLQKLLSESQEVRNRVLRNKLQDVIIRRFAVFNLRRALKQITKLPEPKHFSLVKAIFQEVSSLDLNHAISEAKLLDDALKRAAVEGILTSRMDLATNDRRTISRELDNEDVFHDLMALELVEKRIDHPADMWNQLVREYGNNFESLSDEQQEALLHVTRAWVSQGGLRAIDAINSMFPQRDHRVWLIQQLLTTLVSDDVVIAGDIVENLRVEDRVELIEVVQTWAQQDGLEAFVAAHWMDSNSNHPWRMQRAAIEAWARANPHSLIANVAQLPEHLREYSQNTALLEMRWTSPESVAALLKDVSDADTREWLRSNLQSSWVQTDPSSALRWALDNKDTYFTLYALGAVAGENLQEALDFALKLPIAANGIGPEAAVASAAKTHDEKLRLMEHMRTDETRMNVYQGIVGNLMHFENYERILSLPESESDEFRLNYFKSVAWRIAMNSPRFLVEKFDSLPSNEYKQHTSEILLRNNSQSPEPFLSDEEIQKLEQFAEENAEL